MAEEHNYESQPVCPYCGAKMQDAWDLELKDDDPDTVECGSCEREFIIVLHVEYSYSTRPIESEAP